MVTTASSARLKLVCQPPDMPFTSVLSMPPSSTLSPPPVKPSVAENWPSAKPGWLVLRKVSSRKTKPSVPASKLASTSTPSPGPGGGSSATTSMSSNRISVSSLARVFLLLKPPKVSVWLPAARMPRLISTSIQSVVRAAPPLPLPLI